uniref:NADH-ubiquinone oxidoreductase chain 6 n=1 Tax=Coleoptera sp. ACP-2013 TaxID=2485033 RepID=A0A3G3MEX1_9COLE|nr:NADH dehydrogenase subunit 6 [Coleoptera sp. ACP-2013]
MTHLLIMLTLLFIFLKHPLSLTLTIILQTMMIALISGMLNLNFWFSYILFLILIGGMMILFIYMTSIASNEKFKFSMNIFLTMMITLGLSNMFINNNLIQNFKNIELTFTLPFILNKYFNSNSILTFSLIIIYLLITLIMIVNMTIMSSSTLRQMN